MKLNVKIITLCLCLFTVSALGDSWNITSESDLVFDHFFDVQVRDGIAYCSTTYGLVLMDVSDPQNPEVIRRIPLPGPGLGLLLQDTLLYLCNGSSGFRIYSVADPENPIEIGICRDPRNATRFVLCDTLAFIANYRSTFDVVSVADPFNPVLVGRNNRGGNGVALYQDYAYTCGSNSWTRLLSIEDPTQPEHLASFEYMIGGEPQVIGDLLFSRSFKIYDIRDPVNPLQIYRSNHGTGDSFEIVGDLLFIPIWYDDDYLWCIDISNPENPVRVGGCAPSYVNQRSGGAIGLEYEGGLVYVCAGPAGMSINDFRDPEEPEEVWNLEAISNEPLMDMVIDDDVLYAAQGRLGRLIVISLENPERPELIGSYGEYSAVFGVDVKDNLVFATADFPMRNYDGIEGLLIWDKSDPYDLVYVGGWESQNNLRALRVYEDYAYAASSNILFVISIENPENPELVYTYRGLRGEGYRIDNVNDLLFIAELSGGIEVLSLEDPARPIQIGYYNTPDEARDIAVRGDYAYVTDVSSFGAYNVSHALGAWFLGLSEDSHDYDDTRADSTSEWELTITNVTESPREISNIESDNQAFTCQFDDPFDLLPDTDTTFTVSFSPIADTSYTGTLTIRSGEKAVDVRLSGRGIVIDGVSPEHASVSAFGLTANYPNPFNSSIVLSYSLNQASDVTIKIFDLTGREITTLYNGNQSVGYHSITWNSNNAPTGVYVCRLITGAGQIDDRKLALIR